MQVTTSTPSNTSPFLASYPSPVVVQEAFAGGYTEKGTPILTLEWLRSYDSYEKGRGNERRFICPFCGSNERAFNVNLQTGRFNCKRSNCQVKGTLREFWQDRPQMTRRQVAAASLNRAFSVKPTGSRTAHKSNETSEPDLSNWRALWESAHSLDEAEAQPGREYLSERGLDVQTAIRAGIRFCRNWAPSPEGKRYRTGAAVLFPMHNEEGELVGANGRFLTPWQPPQGDPVKTITGGFVEHGVFFAPAVVGGAVMQPLDHERPVLVEGPADALAVAACGVPAIACVGVNLQQWLPAALAFKAPFISSDADEAGDKAAGKWLAELKPNAPRVSRLRPDGGKDFGEVGELCGPVFLRSILAEAGAVLDDDLWDGVIGVGPIEPERIREPDEELLQRIWERREAQRAANTPNPEGVQESAEAVKTRKRGSNAQKLAFVNWRLLSGAECSRAVHRERLRYWDVLSEAGNGRLPERDGAALCSTVLEANHDLLYLTSIIAEECRQFTTEEAKEIESALNFLDYATSGLILTDSGGFDWIDPEALADRTEAHARDFREQYRARRNVDEVLEANCV